MKLLVFAALLFICGVQSSQLVSDPCTLVPTAPATSWYGGLSPVRACFTSIPFSATRANATITLLRQLLDLYVFTDILKDTGAPWNQKIDLVARLDQIAAASYTSDYAFQSDVVNLFNSLNDAHTRYVLPYPYANVVVIRPFGIQLVNENGTLRFYVTQSSYVTPAGSKYYVSFDPSPYFGGELTAIDGTPILEWFLNFGNNFVGTYKDPAIRFNAALKALGTFNILGGYLFSINDIANSCTMTINGTDVVAPYLVIFYQGVSSTSNAVAQIDTPRQGKRSTAESEFVPYQPDLHREQRERLQWVKTVPGDDANRKRFDYNSLNTKAVQKRSNQQASDQYVLSVKTGNSSNFNIVTQSSDKSIWWGTYTTTDAQVVPYLRIYSFAPNNSVEFVSILTAFSNYISTNQIDRVLVDVSGNGGGTICLGYQASSIFSSKFRGVTNYERYDVRRTASNSDLVQGGYLVPSGYLQISNGQLYTDNSWFNPRTVTRGGQSSTLSQQVYFPSECYADMDSIAVSRFPADPIIITDGTCGSTCSLFTTKFVEYGVGRVFTYGGVPGTVMDSTSFGGGNIEDWSSLIQYTSTLTLSNPIIAPTTSAAYTFTHHEMYSGTTVEVPREYRSMPGLYHSYFYDLFTATTTHSSQQALADLYETAVVAWTITPPVPVSPPVADVTPSTTNVTPITDNVPSSTPIAAHTPGSRPTVVVSVATSVVSQAILLVVTFFCLTL